MALLLDSLDHGGALEMGDGLEIISRRAPRKYLDVPTISVVRGREDISKRVPKHIRQRGPIDISLNIRFLLIIVHAATRHPDPMMALEQAKARHDRA